MKKSIFIFSLFLLAALASYAQTRHKTGSTTKKAGVVVKSASKEVDKTDPVRTVTGASVSLRQAAVPDLTPTVLMNDLNFSSSSVGVTRDFSVTINEINSVATNGVISFKIFKPSAFAITYSTTSGNSDVYPGVANTNGEWDFLDTDNYITVTSKAGTSISTKGRKVVGFHIARRADIPENTQQNVTVSIAANSGGEAEASNNITGFKVNAADTASPLVFSVKADSIKVDPYGYAPLSALVNFSVSALGKTYIRVRGKHGKITNVEHTFNDTGLQHSIPLIGLYPDYTNTVDIRIVGVSGDTLAKSSMTIQTAPLSAGIPLPISIVSAPFDEANVSPGLILVSCFAAAGTGKPFTPFFMDAYGDIRWLLDYRNHPLLNNLNYENGIWRLRNGNFFFGNSSIASIHEVDLLGKLVNTWNVSSKGYLFHHDVVEKPNGNFLLTATKPGSTYKVGYKNGGPTTEDYVVEINRQNGDIETVWDLKESLDETRINLTDAEVSAGQTVDDWFHGNAVMHDSTDNTIVVSGRSQGVVKLDYNNSVKWIMSAHAGWTTNRRGEDLNQFLLKPIDATGNLITDSGVINGTTISPDFEWNWYQHNNTFLPNGDLLIFDNGAAREFDASSPKYSRAVSYRIDPIDKTIQQTWSYGKERGIATYSKIVSSAQYLPQADHVLFAPGFQVPNTNGTGGKVVEIDLATKQVVSEISIACANAFGHHRARKLSAYP